MLKKLLPMLLAALALTSPGVRAQTSPVGRNWCGTDAERERYFAEHPGAREAQQLFEQRITAAAQAQLRGAAYVTDVTIPVVVHIFHAGGTENISDRQINSAIAQLNLDYQKLNADTTSTSPLFRPIAASVGFQFRLAKKDPNGNCTTGITRHYAPNLITDDGSGAVQAFANWDRSRYLNVWVVRSIASGAAGYVNPPNTPTNIRDGFVVLSTYFGTQGTSSLFTGRAATHEIGHYFGLSHTWGGTNTPGTGNCTGDDFVADTPQTDGSTTCNLNYAPCGPVANVQNYMDYAYCFTMFTQGQRARMRAVLAANRTTLVSPANLVATGTNDGYVASDCAPIAEFGPTSSTNVCVNTPVTLRDYSYNFSPTGGTLSYSWSAPGATFVGPSTSQSVTLSYANAGFYSVTETVSNGVGSTTSTQTNLIRVEGPTGGETAPLQQSFEDPAFPALFPNPTLRNYDLAGTSPTGTAAAYRWQRQASLPAADGNASLLVANRVLPAGATTTLITPNLNLASLSGTASVRFARAYALRATSDNIQLRVSFSNDCGVNWSAPTTLTVADLSTQGLTPADGFVPTGPASWQDATVAIPAQFQRSGLFKIRFQLVNGASAGNNFYFDNLRVGNALATRADALAQHGLALFPNPLTHETALHLALPAAARLGLTLRDVLGRPVASLPVKAYPAGQQAVALPAAAHALAPGVYLLTVTLDGHNITSKITVE